MSGGKVVAWVCFQPPGSADPEIYFQPDCPYPEPTADTGIWQPLVLQSDLAAAIARAEAAEARGVMLTMGLRAAVTALAHASESDAIYTRTYEHASNALRDYAIDRAAIAAQQAEGE